MNYDIDGCVFNQGFGANPAVYGPELKGHPGIDVQKGYGTPIHSPVDMHVYKVLTVEEPSNDGTGFTGVFGIVDDGIECYELLIGHCDPVALVGENIHRGDVIGTEANHGLVYADGKEVTLAEQKAGSHAGEHRHIQKKPVMKVPRTQPGQQYLSAYSDWPAGALYYDPNGYYYQVWDYNNGFHGCVDASKSIFSRDLTNGISGYDVYVLQRILVKAGMGSFAPTGFFGTLTKQALAKFQSTIGVHPDVGYFGPLTRKAITSLYNV